MNHGATENVASSTTGLADVAAWTGAIRRCSDATLRRASELQDRGEISSEDYATVAVQVDSIQKACGAMELVVDAPAAPLEALSSAVACLASEAERIAETARVVAFSLELASAVDAAAAALTRPTAEEVARAVASLGAAASTI